MFEQNYADKNKKQLDEIKLSVLDLAPIVSGSHAGEALGNSLSLAQHAEKWGFNRYWLAEHHNMRGIASSATSVVIGHIAQGTSTIRVGSGGIMLPNHAPLVIAEQFGTLESLFPGRIDLGLGRAPGTDQLTAQALRRELKGSAEDFPEQVEELRAYFNPTEYSHVKAIPGEGLNIPVWLLGSSGFSAHLAGQLGLPFAFASHFSPDHTVEALRIYRNHFKPSEVLDEPYAMVGVNVVAADSEAQAQYLSTSMKQQFLNLVRGRPGQLNPPVDDMDDLWNDYEKASIQQTLRASAIGDPDQVKAKLQSFLNETQADEMMITANIFDHQARLRSYEIVSQLVK
ncbi:LLM class flavin-dependent oxidoreductase [Bacillus sp. FJAT-42376]|uniref:LLM class flavin-dependent oxidoreductase n=1 Tax=Bacillus sp. FJAT-42376 TaxID=2014076 RepID=UPI000F4E3329|nr:LLM class flavin-dependent oxidoreductase [Bacillus sp. FJAT-42376]AZB43145.1 LLM class flavin-dependent oxidoreductase [Bacillus sp. FJAT-42376]